MMVILTSPVFCNVTFWVAVDCRFSLPKLTEVGVTCRATTTFSATPASETAAGECGALLVMVREAEAFPAAVGANASV